MYQINGVLFAKHADKWAMSEFVFGQENDLWFMFSSQKSRWRLETPVFKSKYLRPEGTCFLLPGFDAPVDNSVGSSPHPTVGKNQLYPVKDQHTWHKIPFLFTQRTELQPLNQEL